MNTVMSKQRWIFILGIWVALLPFFGFPHSWKNTLFVITGLGLIYLSYLLRRERKGIAPQAEPETEKPDTFTDNGHEMAQKHKRVPGPAPESSGHTTEQPEIQERVEDLNRQNKQQ